jgi:beta-lactamase class C
VNGRLGLRHGAPDGTGARRKGLQSFVFVRRFLLLLAAMLGLAGIVWAAARLDIVRPAAPPPSPEEQAAEVRARTLQPAFEAAVADRGPPARGRIDYARLDERLGLLMQRPHMVGLAVAVIEEGEIRFLKGYGRTASDREEPVTPDTVFRWASLSKGVAGDMVALLAAERKVGLYDPIARWSPTLRLPGGTEANATVSDVLTHRLGIFAHAFDSKLEDGEDPRLLRIQIASLNAICPPGQCHAYQNVAYDAAAELVERATGQSYEAAVRERLFLPLGMTTASMSLQALMAAPSWARPHVGGASPRPVEDKEAYYRVPAAGGVNGSIKDLALWLRAQMGGASAILTSEILAEVQRPRADTPRENARRRKYRERIQSSSYGLGWRIFDYAGNKVVGHRGGVRGYRSLILFDPARRSGVVALWNSSTAQPGGLEYEVMDMVYGLEFRDWLELNAGTPATGEPESETNEGGSAG